MDSLSGWGVSLLGVYGPLVHFCSWMFVQIPLWFVCSTLLSKYETVIIFIPRFV